MNENGLFVIGIRELKLRDQTLDFDLLGLVLHFLKEIILGVNFKDPHLQIFDVFYLNFQGRVFKFLKSCIVQNL